jgi:cardiolipin synthase
MGIVYTMLWWGVLRMAEPASWPPAADAVTADGALAATAAFVADEDMNVNDLGTHFAWTTAATVEPLVDGTRFYPRMLEDIAAARNSVHLLQYGFTPGEIGDEFATAFEDAVARGVEVRVIVDEYGSRTGSTSEEFYDRLAASGVQVLVSDIVPPSWNGLWPDRDFDSSFRQVGHYEHRKLLVVDGRVAYTGGAGIQDHFANGSFHDVMTRVTGDVVRELQMVFLTTFHAHGGPLESDGAALARYFPAQDDPGTVPAIVVGTRHTRDVSALQATREMIDRAQRRIDITNPYFTADELVDRIIAAAGRGVRVRVLVGQESNSAIHPAALRHDYRRLLDAGVEIWEYPDAVVHGKVLVADDAVMFGTVNLDAWALWRAYEVGVIVDDVDTAGLFESRLFEPDIAISRAGVAPTDTGTRVKDWLADALSYFL